MIAASAGNHALALAYHGQLLGIKVTVVRMRRRRPCGCVGLYSAVLPLLRRLCLGSLPS